MQAVKEDDPPPPGLPPARPLETPVVMPLAGARLFG